MKAKHLILPFAMLFIALFIGCAKDDFVEVPGVCPLVIATSPEDGEINVVLDKTITATFNEPMNPATFNASSFIVTESTAAKSTAATTISGTITFSGVTASFDPASPLTDNTTYTGTIKTSVKDFAGNALQEDYVWTFSTGSFLPPTVISNFPDVDAVDVDPVDLEIKATFSQKMLASSITAESTFTLRQGEILIPGTVSYVDSTATFIPESDLELGEIYTATISTAAENLDNIAMLNDYVWSFTTLTPNPPEITAIDPYNLETDVLLDKVISATFNEEMDALTITDLTFTLIMEGTTTPIIGLVEYSGLTATFDPEIDLLPNTTYEATITTGAMNLGGIALENDSVWSFTTIEQFTLTIIAENGQVVVDPDQPAYDYGTIVTLTAIPDVGYLFDSWSGDATGITLTEEILMDADKTVTANFIPESIVCFPPVNLGLAGDYVILAQSGISNTGATTSITGDMGISPATSTGITGFALDLPAGSAFSTSNLVTGNIYAPDYADPTPALLTEAITNMTTAFTTGNGLAPDVTELASGFLEDNTLAPGVYKWSTDVSITTGITLDGGGDPCASWVFQIAGDLTVANGAIITLAGGADAKNIFWIVAGTKADLGTTVDFSGNILCKELISLKDGAVVTGRLLSQTAVTLIGNTAVMPE